MATEAVALRLDALGRVEQLCERSSGKKTMSDQESPRAEGEGHNKGGGGVCGGGGRTSALKVSK